MSRWFISDIHGMYDEFDKILNKIGLSKDDELYLLGDYVDRGNFSFEVISKILELIDSGYNVNALVGNHEDMMIKGIENKTREDWDLWTYNGGEETIRSYGGGEPLEYQEHPYGKLVKTYTKPNYPERHLRFIRELPDRFIGEDFFACHATPNPWIENPFEKSARQHLIWERFSRREFLRHNPDSKQIISGHTPQFLDDIKKDLDEGSKWLIIDGGCYYKRHGYGNLVAFNLDEWRIEVVENKG